jgi:predicted flap endonuclease-1-like 5' DNA nuclease
MRGVATALGEIALFLLLAGVLGLALGFVLRDWLFANRADELDELLRRERADARRAEAAAAAREHQMKRTIVAREALIEEMRAGAAPHTMVLSSRPFRPGAVVQPPVPEAGVVAVAGTQPPTSEVAAADESTSGPDDLRRIRGIGPTIARRLKENGITRFRQLAVMSPDELDDLADTIRIARGRVAQDDWAAAAAALDGAETAQTRDRSPSDAEIQAI